MAKHVSKYGSPLHSIAIACGGRNFVTKPLVLPSIHPFEPFPSRTSCSCRLRPRADPLSLSPRSWHTCISPIAPLLLCSFAASSEAPGECLLSRATRDVTPPTGSTNMTQWTVGESGSSLVQEECHCPSFTRYLHKELGSVQHEHFLIQL